ncbi:MAG: amidohydrolase [Candidatus Krumholzibacteria bacterium]|nr:amidohydrolase [Candidatus Krumholzibacteria bacterium]
MEADYFNGKIYTMDGANSVVEALSTSGGRIVETGSASTLRSHRASGAPRIDLHGLTVIPALTDAHVHVFAHAEAGAWLDLAAARSLEDVLESVSARLAAVKKGSWILGKGWDQNAWPDARFPGKWSLDSIAPDNPVYLKRVCGHAAFVNSAGLRAAGITRNTPDPPCGRVLRDALGEPTGILLDSAAELAASRIPYPTREEKKRFLAVAARRCLASGLVCVHEMGLSEEAVSIYRELDASGELPIRVTAYLSADDAANGSFLESGPPPGRADGLFRIIGAKFYMDGSLGARSAALLADYSDDPGNRGILMHSAESLVRAVLPWHERGFQAAVHAIGDAAVRAALDACESLGRGGSTFDRRIRIEHAQVVSEADIPRFAKLAVVPSMQFIHCTSDMTWAQARLGSARDSRAYAWRSLVETGAGICGGSDFPVESINPFRGIHAAITRRNAEGLPEEGWRSEERLTAEEAVRAFTVGAAYAAHAEADAGSLSPGKLADFDVLSGDIFAMEPDGIMDVRVLATVLGGEIVHRSDAF